MLYTPFKNNLEDLSEDDLQELINNEIVEGWYIEYKSTIPKKDSNLDKLKIVKSISSFANTKGGWIFWGIECDKNVATKLAGVDVSKFNNFQDQISQIIASNINPTPIYSFKEVTLSNELVVFIIKVEESPLPPYITSQGVIYQRENNESKPIKDRYIVEKLNEKAEDYINTIEQFSEFDLGETKGQSEANQSFLEVYLYPKPFNNFKFKDFHTSEFFKYVAAAFYKHVDCKFNLDDEEFTVPLNLNFNSIYTTGESLIIRPLTERSLIYKTTTIELYRNGNLKFTIPLQYFSSNDIPSHYKDSETLKYILDKFCPEETVTENRFPFGYKNELEPLQYKQRKQTDFTHHVDFIDGVDIIFVLLILIAKYETVMENGGFDMSTDIGFRARVTNVWRKFVFFDSKDYLEKLKLFNVPLTPKNEIEIPSFKKGQSYSIKLDNQNTYLTLAIFILKGIGLPDSSSLNYTEIIKNGIKRYRD